MGTCELHFLINLVVVIKTKDTFPASYLYINLIWHLLPHTTLWVHGKRLREEMSLVTEEVKAKAEVYYGDEICQEKSKFLLKEVGLPRGLLPLKDIIECGYVEETGFVWLKQKNKTTHYFEQTGKNVSYATEVTAYVEKHRIKKLTGVKAKELLIWITLNEIYLNDPPDGKIVFKTPAGLSKSFPAAAFELEEDKEDKK